MRHSPSRSYVFKNLCLLGLFLFSYPSYSNDKPQTEPLDSAKGEPPELFSAISNENVELYSKEMSRLLHEPITKFKETVLFKTAEGDTILHLMARVQSHQEYFAKEIQTLADVLDGAFASKKSEGDLSLGGVSYPIPYLEDTELGKAIVEKDVLVIVSIANHLRKIPAIEWIQYLNTKSKNGQSLRDFAFQHLSISQLSSLQDHKVEQKIKEYTQVFPSVSIKNQKGLSPKDTAYASKNLPAYTLFADMEKSDPMRYTLGVSGAVLGSILPIGVLALGLSNEWEWLAFLEPEYFKSLIPDEEKFSVLSLSHLYLVYLGLTGVFVGGGLGGRLATGACYDLFQKRKAKQLSQKPQNKKAL